MLLPGCDDEYVDSGPGGGQSAPAPAGEGGSWSVFLYLCGTDLETEGAMASENLAELFEVDWNEDVNVYVQTGGTLSVFFPLNVTEGEAQAISAGGEAIIPSGNYRSFVDYTLHLKQEAAQDPGGAVHILTEAHFDEELNYVMTIDPASMNYVDDVEFSVFWNLGDSYVYLGSDNEVYLDWETGEMQDNFWG